MFNIFIKRLLVLFAIFLSLSAHSYAFTLNVVGCDADNNCNLSVNGFRWLLEEDNTTQSPPGVRVPDSISLTIHNSYAPVVSKGHSDSSSVTINVDPSRPYYISVLPDSGFTLSGNMVPVGAGSVTVKVHKYPIPTAQISVFAFKDHRPINNVFDPAEEGIGGATVLIFDQLGQMSADAFGNPLGTEYDSNL